MHGRTRTAATDEQSGVGSEGGRVDGVGSEQAAAADNDVTL